MIVFDENMFAEFLTKELFCKFARFFLYSILVYKFCVYYKTKIKSVQAGHHIITFNVPDDVLSL